MKTRYNKMGIKLFILSLICVMGCKKFVTVETPVTQVSTESAFKSDNTAAAVLTGILAQMSNSYINNNNIGATSFLAELSADNLVLYDEESRPELSMWYFNALDPTYSASFDNTYWRTVYTMMFTINSSIEMLSNNTVLTPSVRQRLIGEAYFLRGFCYFYLVNLYGDVPLVLTSKYVNNSRIARSSSSEVYKQISSDLARAQDLLDNRYLSADAIQSSANRLRPNLSAVYALQARVFLYQKDYVAAENAASMVIAQSGMYALTDLSSTFLANSSETIWALQSVNIGYNTWEGQIYTLPTDGPDYDRPSYLSESLMKSFEPGDDRKNEWIGNVTVGIKTYPFSAKYKVPYTEGSQDVTEYNIVLRLSEQYLIRAEARNETGNFSGAIEDLNRLRTRSRGDQTIDIPNPLPNLSSSLSQNQIRAILQNERRVELFTEWGQRWFDIKRSGAIDAIMTEAQKYKGGQWVNSQSLYPIPVSEILLNPSLTQNKGY
ncbi:MAG: RagB/SusD family nutrient uptake outer membrane protein [Bacteroidota bacterium]